MSVAARQKDASPKLARRSRRVPAERDPPGGATPANPGAEWVLVLHRCWRTSGPSDQQKALKWLRRAQGQEQVESCLRDLQKGLRAIHVGEMQIIGLILIEHLTLVTVGRVDSVRDIARQVCEVLESLQTGGSGPHLGKRKGPGGRQV